MVRRRNSQAKRKALDTWFRLAMEAKRAKHQSHGPPAVRVNHDHQTTFCGRLQTDARPG